MATANDAKKRMQEISASLTAHDFTPDTWVMVQDEDGSSMLFHSALVLAYNGWVFVFTEHHGEHFFWAEDTAITVFKNVTPMEFKQADGFKPKKRK